MYGALSVANSVRTTKKGKVAVNGMNGYTLVTSAKGSGSLVSSSQDVTGKIGVLDPFADLGGHQNYPSPEKEVAFHISPSNGRGEGTGEGSHQQHQDHQPDHLHHHHPPRRRSLSPEGILAAANSSSPQPTSFAGGGGGIDSIGSNPDLAGGGSSGVAGLNNDGSFSRGGSFNRRHFVNDPDKQAQDMRKSKDLAEDLKRQMAERNQYQQAEVSRYRNDNNDSDSYRSPQQQQQQQNNRSSPGPRYRGGGGEEQPRTGIDGGDRFISPSRRAPVPGHSSYTQNSTAQLGLYNQQGSSSNQNNSNNGDYDQRSPEALDGGRGGGAGSSGWNQGLTSHGASSQEDNGGGSYGRSVNIPGGAKAAPEWLDGGEEEEGEGATRTDRPHQNHRAPPALRNSSSPKRSLFDHERRQLEEVERQKLGLLKQEELRQGLEEQIAENRRRKEREREAELELEREIEERRRAEAEAVAAREQAEINKEREGGGPAPNGKFNDNIHKVESVQDKRRRLREDQIRAQQEQAALDLKNQAPAASKFSTTPQRTPNPTPKPTHISPYGGSLHEVTTPQGHGGKASFPSPTPDRQSLLPPPAAASSAPVAPAQYSQPTHRNSSRRGEEEEESEYETPPVKHGRRSNKNSSKRNQKHRYYSESDERTVSESPMMTPHPQYQNSPYGAQGAAGGAGGGGMVSPNGGANNQFHHQDQQEILDSLEVIKRELLEQRRRAATTLPFLPPMPAPAPAPAAPVVMMPAPLPFQSLPPPPPPLQQQPSEIPALAADDGSLVSQTHQVSVKQSSMTPPSGGPKHWNSGPQPYENKYSMIPISIAEYHPAREVLERNKYRLAGLRNARHQDDILKSFLMEDSRKAVRGLDRMTEYH